MRDSDTTFHRAFRISSSGRLIDGDALPQRVRLGAATGAISQVKRDVLNANLMSPRSSSTYLGAEARAHNDADCALSPAGDMNNTDWRSFTKWASPDLGAFKARNSG